MQVAQHPLTLTDALFNRIHNHEHLFDNYISLSFPTWLSLILVTEISCSLTPRLILQPCVLDSLISGITAMHQRIFRLNYIFVKAIWFCDPQFSYLASSIFFIYYTSCPGCTPALCDPDKWLEDGEYGHSSKNVCTTIYSITCSSKIFVASVT